MKLLPNRDIYKNTDECISYLSKIPKKSFHNSARRVLFHCYWGNDFCSKASLSIRSFLATQNLNNAELWLWLSRDAYYAYSTDPFLGPLLSKIEIKLYDPMAEALNTPVCTYVGLLDKSLLGQSDLFRILILYKYGGFYFDLDIIFLRDFTDIVGFFGTYEFCYQWASERYANSAILGLKKNSAIAFYLLRKGTICNSFHPKHLLQTKDKLLELLMFPSVFFDPAWLHVMGKDVSHSCPFDSFEDFFRPLQERDLSKMMPSVNLFLENCFTYHWHNQWKSVNVSNSIAGYLSERIDIELANKYNIPKSNVFLKHLRVGSE